MKYYFSYTIANVSFFFCVQLNPVAISAWLAITIQVFIIYHAIINYYYNHHKKH
jgi:hypothetical protein